MAHVIAIANGKGGVGKTTTVANLGAALAQLKVRTLMVDVDPQRSLTEVCGAWDRVVNEDRPQLARLLTWWLENREFAAQEAVTYPAHYCGAGLLPATTVKEGVNELLVVKAKLDTQPGGDRALRSVLDGLVADFDVVLLDSPPALDILTVNILAAADAVLIPMKAEPMSRSGLAEIARFLRIIKRRGVNAALRILGVLLTNVESRRVHTQNMRQMLDAEVRGAGVPIFTAVIPHRAAVVRASGNQQSVVAAAPQDDATTAYLQLAGELVQQLSMEEQR